MWDLSILVLNLWFVYLMNRKALEILVILQ